MEWFLRHTNKSSSPWAKCVLTSGVRRRAQREKVRVYGEVFSVHKTKHVAHVHVHGRKWDAPKLASATCSPSWQSWFLFSYESGEVWLASVPFMVWLPGLSPLSFWHSPSRLPIWPPTVLNSPCEHSLCMMSSLGVLTGTLRSGFDGSFHFSSNSGHL